VSLLRRFNAAGFSQAMSSLTTSLRRIKTLECRSPGAVVFESGNNRYVVPSLTKQNIASVRTDLISRIHTADRAGIKRPDLEAALLWLESNKKSICSEITAV
jgi:hypothetical protein